MFNFILIGFMLLTLTIPISAQDKKSNDKQQQIIVSKIINSVKNNGSAKNIRHKKQLSATQNKTDIINQTAVTPPNIPKLKSLNKQLPSVVNAYNYFYSHQEWQTDNSTTAPSPFGTTKFNEFAFKGNLYYLAPGTSRLPEFSTMTAMGTVYISKIDIPKRTFTTGFPGVDKRFEWFGIRYIGAFKLQQGGKYNFRLVSDDGSKLWINNQLIINNDGIHSPQARSGVIELSSGKHLIQVDYFQGPRKYIALQLYVTPPNGIETIFSPELISNLTVNSGIVSKKNMNNSSKFILKFIK
jgi:hypothetical protein